jgi:UPF0716 protein FxsA
MALLLLLALLAVPIVEIAIFILIGEEIGPWPTIALVFVAAAAGLALVRSQGMAAASRVQRSLAEDRLPVAEAFDGMCILLAGALLVVPGFLTDAIAIALLLPPVRGVLGRAIWRALQRADGVTIIVNGRMRRGGRGGPVIDGEFREVREPDEPAGRRRLPP